MFETTLDRIMYPIGFETTMKEAVRKWKHRPALVVGQKVTVRQIDWEEICRGTFLPRVQVEAADGTRRWISATKVEPCMTGNEKALARMGEIASDILSYRD